MQIPIDQYSPEIRYIYTKDRPELGKVTQRNYKSQNNFRYMQLSGYFIEKELDRHAVYANGTSNITDPAAWIIQSGKAEDVAYAFFDAFKTICVGDVISDLEVVAATSQGRGKHSEHTRNGEYLGNKIYNILKPSGLSYRVTYDFVNSVRNFEVWSGVDRTQENTENNNPVIFSTKYGNIKNPDILLDDTDYKNACIVTNEKTENGVTTVTCRAIFNAAAGDTEYAFLSQKSNINSGDYSEEDFPLALENEAINGLGDYPKTINVEFDAIEGSYEYMVDFDIGDLCNIEIPEVNFSAQARLIGCYEVMKSGKWTMTMEFGTPIIIRK